MNIFPFESIIKSKDRHALNKHRSGLLWFTGLSGSGKSTLAHAERKYWKNYSNVECLF